MVLTGLAFLVTWLLVQVFSVELLHAILAVAIIWIVVGIIMGERPFIKHP